MWICKLWIRKLSIDGQSNEIQFVFNEWEGDFSVLCLNYVWIKRSAATYMTTASITLSNHKQKQSSYLLVYHRRRAIQSMNLTKKYILFVRLRKWYGIRILLPVKWCSLYDLQWSHQSILRICIQCTPYIITVTGTQCIISQKIYFSQVFRLVIWCVCSAHCAPTRSKKKI